MLNSTPPFPVGDILVTTKNILSPISPHFIHGPLTPQSDEIPKLLEQARPTPTTTIRLPTSDTLESRSTNSLHQLQLQGTT